MPSWDKEVETEITGICRKRKRELSDTTQLLQKCVCLAALEVLQLFRLLRPLCARVGCRGSGLVLGLAAATETRGTSAVLLLENLELLQEFSVRGSSWQRARAHAVPHLAAQSANHGRRPSSGSPEVPSHERKKSRRSVVRCCMKQKTCEKTPRRHQHAAEAGASMVSFFSCCGANPFTSPLLQSQFGECSQRRRDSALQMRQLRWRSARTPNPRQEL